MSIKGNFRQKYNYLTDLMKDLAQIFNLRQIPVIIQNYLCNLMHYKGYFEPTVLMTDLRLAGFSDHDINIIVQRLMKAIPNQTNSPAEITDILTALISLQFGTTEQTWRWLCILLEKGLLDKPHEPQSTNNALADFQFNGEAQFKTLILYANNDYEAVELLQRFHEIKHLNRAKNCYLLIEDSSKDETEIFKNPKLLNQFLNLNFMIVRNATMQENFKILKTIMAETEQQFKIGTALLSTHTYLQVVHRQLNENNILFFLSSNTFFSLQHKIRLALQECNLNLRIDFSTTDACASMTDIYLMLNEAFIKDIEQFKIEKAEKKALDERLKMEAENKNSEIDLEDKLIPSTPTRTNAVSNSIYRLAMGTAIFGIGYFSRNSFEVGNVIGKIPSIFGSMMKKS